MLYPSALLAAILSPFHLTFAAPTPEEVGVFPTDNFVPLTRIRNAPPPIYARASPGTIAEDPGQAFYAAPVKVGGVTFKLFVDTGSPTTWVSAANNECRSFKGERCTFGATKGVHLAVTKAELDAGASSTSPNYYFMSYMDETNFTGAYVDRAVSVAGVTMPHQWVVAATRILVPECRAATSMDGLLGLGPPGAKDRKPFFLNALDTAGAVKPSPQFSIAMFGGADYNPNKPDSGLLTFGGYPASLKKTSEWAIAPIYTQGPFSQWYTINVDEYVLNGKKIKNPGMPLVVDSGTTITELPPEVANEIFKLLPGEAKGPNENCPDKVGANQKCLDKLRHWRIPCKGTMPSFSVVIGGVQLAFQPENMSVQQGKDACIAGVAPAEPRERRGVLGFSFIKNDILVLHDYTDRKQPKIMMAKYKDGKN